MPECHEKSAVDKLGRKRGITNLMFFTKKSAMHMYFKGIPANIIN